MKTDYFELIVSQAQCAQTAAELLRDIFADYRPDALAEPVQRMHEIEHRADEIRHEAVRQLAKDFITPIDQADLAELTRRMDDVTDAIDETAISLHMYAVRILPEDASRLVGAALECVAALGRAATEFRNHRKPDGLMKRLIDVNSAESRADAVYTEAMHSLFAAGQDPLWVMGVKAVYDGLESCCDMCEQAADVMESVVMGNL